MTDLCNEREKPDHMFERIAIVIESLVLALWSGSMAGFAFVFAPIAFRSIGNVTTFGAVTGGVLRALATFGTACGLIAIGASFARPWNAETARLRVVRSALICVAFAATAYEQRVVLPAMEAAAARIPGALDSVAKDDPRRAAYDEQHTASTRAYGLAFLCVAAATTLVAFGRTKRP